MTWDWLVQPTEKYCSTRRMEHPEFQTGIFGRMESTLGLTNSNNVQIHPLLSKLLVQKNWGLWGVGGLFQTLADRGALIRRGC